MSEPAAMDRLPADRTALSRLDDAFRVAESLEPDDRLRLIVRMWASLPPEHWAAPTARELIEVARRLNNHESQPAVDPPWELVRQMVFKQVKSPPKPPSRIYSAPRRFDLATIFIATAAYSLLFGIMTLLDFAPVVKLYIGVLITIVGASQALLMNVLDARRASIMVGASVHTIFSLVLFAMEPRFFGHSLIVAVLINGMAGGALFGYLAGVMAAGVFLVADLLRGKFVLNPPVDNPDAAEVESLNDAASMNATQRPRESAAISQ